MINELYYLSKKLKECGVTTKRIHPWIQVPKKGVGLRVVLDISAHVKKVEYLIQEDVASLWNIKQSNQGMFPLINLKTPLWEVKEQSDIEQLLELRKKKRSVAESIEHVSSITQRAGFCFTKAQDVFNKLYKLPQESLIGLIEDDAQEFEAFRQLIEICAHFNAEDAIMTMIHEFSIKFLEALQQGKIDDESLMHSVFFGKWQEKTKSFGEASITLFFDVDYTNRTDLNFYEISSSEMRDYINKRLFETLENGSNETDGSYDAFGRCGTFVSKLPEPNLPALGPSYLMSMNEKTPCHNRYGNIGSSIFPVCQETANSMNDAVSYLKKAENQGKTWEKIPYGKKNDLLLVYLEEMPDAGVEFANAFGAGVENKDFEDYASAVCDTLHLKIGECEHALIRLLLIQWVNKGQRTIRFETGFTVKELDDAVKFWCDAGRNIPVFYLPFKVKGKDEVMQISPRAPFPAKIFESLQFQWLNNGSNRKDIKGGRLGDMYELFLHPKPDLASKHLNLLLRRTGAFLIRFKQSQAHGSLRPWKGKEYETYKRIVLDSVAFTGILLQTLGRKKEDYMKDSGYYIGRLLNLADLLHEQYCIHVRNGGDIKKGLPPQLLGNSLMRGVMDNPVQALARLQERLTVYSAWARKEQGEKGKLAKWAMGEMGRVSETLSELELPTRTNDMMKAEILLGYLAKPEKKEKEAKQ